MTQFADSPSPGVALYVLLFSWFIVDYLFFEQVHLYTYDLFASAWVQMVWGCLVFYPYFTWSAYGCRGFAEPTQRYLAALTVCAGILLRVGAGTGRKHAKTPLQGGAGQKVPRWIKPGTVTDGNRSLLCSGFWGVSRHINYLGEVLMAVGLTLAWVTRGCSCPVISALLYYFLKTRERDDDKRCNEK